MHAKFIARVEEGLQKLQKAMTTGRLKKEGDAQRRLGRLLQKNSRAAQAFVVKIETLAQPEGKAHLRMTWEKDPQWKAYADLSDGCYLLRTNVMDLEPAALWKQYIQLTEAEWFKAIEFLRRHKHGKPVTIRISCPDVRPAPRSCRPQLMRFDMAAGSSTLTEVSGPMLTPPEQFSYDGSTYTIMSVNPGADSFKVFVNNVLFVNNGPAITDGIALMSCSG